MPDDPERGAVAIQQANARICTLREQVACEVADMSAICGLTPDHDRFDMPLILYGIKQASIDPQGFLRVMRQADEREILYTARLYAAIDEGFDWAVSELLEITAALVEDDGWREFAVEVASAQARLPDMAEAIARERMFWAFAHAYVCGAFAAAYPASLLRRFPTTARMHADIWQHDGEGTSDNVVAMQLALIDILMRPNEAGWRALIGKH